MRVRDNRRPELSRETARVCLWLMRDIERLRKLAALDKELPVCGEAVIYDAGEMAFIRPASIRNAVRIVDAYDRAAAAVPAEYRDGVIDNIIKRADFGDQAHMNTWKRWKNVLLTEFAFNLNLI